MPEHQTEFTHSYVQTNAYIINPNWNLQLPTLLLLLSSVDIFLTKCSLSMVKVSDKYLKYISFSLLCPYYF